MRCRSLVLFALCACSGAGGSHAPPNAEPAPADPSPPSVDAPEAPGEPAPEPQAEPPAPEPSPAKPKSEAICAELDENQCVVTEGCEWHSVRKCLEQKKPKTLDD